MWSLGMVSGWWIYSLPHNEVSLLLLCPYIRFGNFSPTFCSGIIFIIDNNYYYIY